MKSLIFTIQRLLFTLLTGGISIVYAQDNYFNYFSTDDETVENNLTRFQFGPLLTTQWNQEYGSGCDGCSHDYNKYMPQNQDMCNDSIYYHFPTGCTVTAIGQVMNYWKHPIVRNNKPEQIDWCNMPEKIQCGTHATPEEMKEAVARLMKLLGDELGVLYGGAPRDTDNEKLDRIDQLVYHQIGGYGFLDPAVALPILKHEFGYSSNARVLYRRAYESVWKRIIMDEIIAGRPVVYWALNDSNLLSGHTFVCDGYSPIGDLFHFNWGHGSEGSWVTLNDLRENETSHWNVLQTAIVGLEPAAANDFCNYSVWLSPFYDDFYNENSISDYSPYTIVPSTIAYLYSADPQDLSIYRTIPTGATAAYRAHEEIVLQDGFTVERGADFAAQIVSCPNCEENRETDITAETEETTGEPMNETAAVRSKPVEEKKTSMPTQANLYPNPTDGNVTVGVDGKVQSVIIYNTMGQPVGGWNLRALASDHITLDLSPLPEGQYLLYVQTSQGTVGKKLIVQRK